MTAAVPEWVGPGSNPLRVLPIPDTEPAPDHPPYATSLPQIRQPTLALALVTTPEELLEELPYVSFGPQPTSRDQLPDPQAWTRRLVQAVVEVLSGVRPLAQLVRWTSPEVHAGLQRRAAGSRSRPGRRAVVRSVHVCEPADGVVEACAVVIAGGRARAVALRLEGLDGRWLVTALQIG